MNHWIITNIDELETLASEAKSKDELLEKLYQHTKSRFPKWKPYIVLRNIFIDADATSVAHSSDWKLRKAVDYVLGDATKDHPLPSQIADRFKETLSEVLQEHYASFASAYARHHIQGLFQKAGVPFSKRIRAGDETAGELNAAEAESLTRMIIQLEEAILKNPGTAANDPMMELFTAFFNDMAFVYIDGSPELNAYHELDPSQKLHARLQVLQMMLNLYSSKQADANRCSK